MLLGASSGEDAVQAVKHGVDGVLVSNHGARQLDGVPATVCVYALITTSLMVSSRFDLMKLHPEGGRSSTVAALLVVPALLTNWIRPGKPAGDPRGPGFPTLLYLY